MAGAYTLTVRRGSRVERERFPTLDAAFDALGRHAEQLAQEAPRSTVDLRVRSFEPGGQVAARVELSGPGRLRPTVRAGLDVRGDGSAEAYLGRTRRTPVTQRPQESALDALRRVLLPHPDDGAIA